MTGEEALPAGVPPRPAAATKAGLDLRLDFFRGVALIFIFLNHIPHNVAAWVSKRNYGFSDATEMFVFVSGYSAILAYGAVLSRQGATMATLRILRRTWQVTPRISCCSSSSSRRSPGSPSATTTRCSPTRCASRRSSTSRTSS